MCRGHRRRSVVRVQSWVSLSEVGSVDTDTSLDQGGVVGPQLFGDVVVKFFGRAWHMETHHVRLAGQLGNHGQFSHGSARVFYFDVAGHGCIGRCH